MKVTKPLASKYVCVCVQNTTRSSSPTYLSAHLFSSFCPHCTLGFSRVMPNYKKHSKTNWRCWPHYTCNSHVLQMMVFTWQWISRENWFSTDGSGWVFHYTGLFCNGRSWSIKPCYRSQRMGDEMMEATCENLYQWSSWNTQKCPSYPPLRSFVIIEDKIGWYYFPSLLFAGINTVTHSLSYTMIRPIVGYCKK